MKNIDFDWDYATNELFEHYRSLSELIINVYSCAQLKREVARNTRDDYCDFGTAKRLYEIFKVDIHNKVAIKEAVNWPAKNKDYVENLVFMMVTEFIYIVQNDIYSANKNIIDKNLNKNLKEVIDYGNERLN